MSETQITEREEKLTLAPAAGPLLTALVCCDFVSQAIGGKYNLLGIFNRVRLLGVPHTFWLYVRITEARAGKLQIIGYNPDNSVGGVYDIIASPQEAAGPIDGTIDIALPFHVEPGTAGTHWFEVRFEGRPLGRIPLIVDENVT